MIHFPGVRATAFEGHFLYPTDPQQNSSDPPANRGRSQRPAEYYSSPVTARPLFPKWVPLGCGTVSLLFILLLFLGGSLVSNGGIAKFLDFSFAQMQGEVDRMFASDVTPDQRKAFDAETNRLRANIKAQKVQLKNLQPLLDSMKDAISDKLVNAAETNEMMKLMRAANAEAERPQPPKATR